MLYVGAAEETMGDRICDRVIVRLNESGVECGGRVLLSIRMFRPTQQENHFQEIIFIFLFDGGVIRISIAQRDMTL